MFAGTGLLVLNGFMVVVLGLCVGSFLNVGIVRLPKEQTIRGRSRCVRCGRVIPWHDNIPLFSYLMLKGKCRFCKAPISVRYFVVEALAGIAFLALYLKFDFSFYLLKYGFLFSLLLLTSFIDIEHHSIPSSICPMGIAAAVLFAAAESLQRGSGDFAVFYLMSIIVTAGAAYLFKLFGDECIALYLALRKKESIEGETEALGLGDVDFMAMIGGFLGWKIALVAFFVAPFLAMVYGIAAIIFKKSHLIPYLPYLSAGVIVAFLWGNVIINFVMRGFLP